ncbi:TonB-dependent receptor [Phenylobacterium soli]|uniref:TonB-dependent receptor n=1 Tax=Phenylobacterium soli TaxID=2170551 RepID=A0A328ABG2_9CAUL|nr:TonB-dependent receptor [Phenylobacterium soli]RAK51787.1 TonB-dependent receptor [Phenylobacterium soli]
MTMKVLFARASVLALAGALASGASAMAQTKPASEANSVEEVVVTGTNIRGAAPVGSTVVSVSREDIQASGAVTTAQLLQETPQVFNLGVSETSRGQSGGSGNITYGTSVNLRGIGPYATLAIVDGRRVIPQGTSGQSVDPSVLPTIMLERVEIVADGASAVYGSDAVAGVVNMILRRNFDGVEMSARYGAGDNYNERQIGVIAGHKWDGGQLTIGYENGYHSALSGLDRDFYRGDLSAAGGGDFRVTQCNPATLTINGVNYAVPATGVTKTTAGGLVANTTNKCDNLKYQDLLPKQEHDSVAFTLDQQVGSAVHLFADGFAARRKFALRSAPATGAFTIRSTSPDFVLPTGVTATSETANYSFAGQLPLNVSSGYSKAYNFSVGGDVKLPRDFRLTATYGYGLDTDLSLSTQGINSTAVNNAIASGAFNPLIPNNPASSLAGFSNAVFFAPGWTILQTWDAKLDGPLLHLPGGDLRVAVGYEGQRFTTQIGIFQGNPAADGSYTSSYRRFARNVNSAYAELLVPIVGPDNAMPGIQKLELDLAGRFDEYSDIGAKTRNPKVGINWQPMDGLMLRASYGKSFRAPGFAQIYGNSSALFVQNYQDPTCNCTITGVAMSGGNLNLQPEKARTYTFGVDYQPAFLPRTKISLSYFDIDYRNQILAVLSDLSLLGRESQYAGTGIIVRNPSAAFINSLTAAPPAGLGLAVRGVLPNPVPLFVDGRSQNLGVTLAKGVDFQLSYLQPTDRYGDFGFGLNGTYFTEYKVGVTPSAPLVEQRNTIFNPLKLRARGSVNWRKDDWAAYVFVNYENSYTNTVPKVQQKVDAYTTVDAHLAYTFFKDGPNTWTKDLTVALDATNLFDTKPPFVNIGESVNGGGGFDPTTTSPVGRVVAISIDKRW